MEHVPSIHSNLNAIRLLRDRLQDFLKKCPTHFGESEAFKMREFFETVIEIASNDLISNQ